MCEIHPCVARTQKRMFPVTTHRSGLTGLAALSSFKLKGDIIARPRKIYHTSWPQINNVHTWDQRIVNLRYIRIIWLLEHHSDTFALIFGRWLGIPQPQTELLIIQENPPVDKGSSPELQKWTFKAPRCKNVVPIWNIHTDFGRDLNFAPKAVLKKERSRLEPTPRTCISRSPTPANPNFLLDLLPCPLMHA